MDRGDGTDIRRSYARAADTAEVDPHHRARLRTDGRYWRLGSILFCVFDTPAQRLVRPPEHIRNDHLDQVVVRVVRTGQVLSRSQRAVVLLKPGDVAIGSYAGAFDEERTAGAWVAAIFARDALPALRGRIPESKVLRGVPASLLADCFLSLAARLDGLAVEPEARLEAMITSLVSACVDGQLTFPPATMDNRTMALRDRVDRIVSMHLSSACLTPARIADLAGVSRSTLYRAYEAEGGVAGLVLRRRLAVVWRDLRSPSLDGLPLSQIAERRGLHNAASFHRAFRRQFGQTPARVRAAGRTGLADCDS